MADEKQVSSTFTSMATEGTDAEAPELGIGMLGYAFMGKAHTNAFKKIPYMMYPPVAIPRLVGIAGRNEAAVTAAAQRYGYEKAYTDWRDMIANDDINVFDNGGPNDAHAEPCNAAAAAGMHVFCEKPLARTAEEAKSMLDAVESAGVKHMVAFNYRFVPAVQQAKKIVESGALGQIYHWRAVYLQEWGMDREMESTWRFQKDICGSGALGDLGAHIIDLARFLVGEPRAVSGLAQTWITERPDGSGGMIKSDVDDGFVALLDFENGALGTVEATRFGRGRKNFNCFEINAENGSIQFNLERLNELNVFWKHDRPDTTQGFHNVLVTEANHPYWENWWPHGHIIGWEHSFAHEFHHFFDAIVNDNDVAPYGADFVDGYRNAVICDAIMESAGSGSHVDIRY
ncbi:MAG: Gfo/Idh/MocA family oxidoreductase [Chloroflexota bacterium]|nr:Gfo/Idh/MocA family oxidoreductase [Chloroflexota bacterium]